MPLAQLLHNRMRGPRGIVQQFYVSRDKRDGSWSWEAPQHPRRAHVLPYPLRTQRRQDGSACQGKRENQHRDQVVSPGQLLARCGKYCDAQISVHTTKSSPLPSLVWQMVF